MSKKVMASLTHPQKVRILYKTILRLHRGLPDGLKTLGDQYTRDEFKRHKNCSTAEVQLFMGEWSKYAVTLSEQLGLRGKPKGVLGDTLDADSLQHFREEQIVQLYELLMAAQTIDETHQVKVVDPRKK